jgi:hypothetical protein
MTTNMIRVDAPARSSMTAHTCARCGHEELARPVWLAERGSNNTAPYGTGCAAHLLGIDETALLAEIAAEEIAADERIARLQGWFNIARPGRYTVKFANMTADRYRYPLAVIERAYRIWKAVGAA